MVTSLGIPHLSLLEQWLPWTTPRGVASQLLFLKHGCLPSSAKPGRLSSIGSGGHRKRAGEPARAWPAGMGAQASAGPGLRSAAVRVGLTSRTEFPREVSRQGRALGSAPETETEGRHGGADGRPLRLSGACRASPARLDPGYRTAGVEATGRPLPGVQGGEV